MIEWEKYAPKNKSSTSKFRNEFPNKKEAEDIAKKGRFGDTMIMHVNPAEVELLAQFAPGGITINPETGQPEAFLPLLAGLVPMITSALSAIGPAIMTGIGAIGTGLGAVGGLAMSGLSTIGGALSSAGSGIAGLFGAGAGANTVGATVAPAAAEALTATAAAPTLMSTTAIPSGASLAGTSGLTWGPATAGMSNVAVGGAGTIAPGALTTGQLASLPSTATQFPGLANVAVPDITSATNIPIESALQSYQAPGINATQYAELQQAKALLNPAALTTPPVVPPVTPTVTPTWAGSPLNPANMGANPAFPPTTGPWNPAPVFPAPGTGPLPQGFDPLIANNIPPGVHGPMPNSITLGGNPAGNPSPFYEPGAINPVSGRPFPTGTTPAPYESIFTQNLGKPSNAINMEKFMQTGKGSKSIGDVLSGMSGTEKVMALFGAGSLIDSLAGDDFEEEEREPYVNSWGGFDQPYDRRSRRENPQAAYYRKLAAGPGANRKARYYGSGIG